MNPSIAVEHYSAIAFLNKWLFTVGSESHSVQAARQFDSLDHRKPADRVSYRVFFQ
jgi:hypothetical protein